MESFLLIVIPCVVPWVFSAICIRCQRMYCGFALVVSGCNIMYFVTFLRLRGTCEGQ